MNFSGDFLFSRVLKNTTIIAFSQQIELKEGGGEIKSTIMISIIYLMNVPTKGGVL